MDQLYKLWPTVEIHLTVHVGVMQDNRRTIWTIKLACSKFVESKQASQTQGGPKVHIWNNWREQWHNKGEEKQPVGLRAYDTIQWAAHHCEYSFSVIPSTVLGQQTWELLWMTCTNAAEHYYSHSPCLLGDSQYKIILYVSYVFWNV